MSEVDALLDLIKTFRTEEDCDTPEDWPTEFAVQIAGDIITGTAEMMGESFPRGWPCGDVNNGIDITWRNREAKRLIILNVRKDENDCAYIYYQDGDAHGVEMNADFVKLWHRLRWMQESA